MGMLRIKNTYVSEVQPSVSDGLWLKVVGGKVALYLIEAGTTKPLELMDDNGTASSQDDVLAETTKKVKNDLIGKNTDKKTASTIYGAKAYAKDQADTVVGTALDEKTADTVNGAKAYALDKANGLLGTAEDTATDMTLYGLKAYIDSKVPAQE